MKKLLPYPKVVAALMLFAVPFTQGTLAANKSWTGSSSTSWNDPNNWSPTGVPTASDEINFFVFNSTATIVIPNGVDAEAKNFDVLCLGTATLNMTVEAGASLTLNSGGAIAHGLSIKLEDGSSSTANVTVDGEMSIENFSSRNIYLHNSGNSSLTFTNNGTINIEDCGTYGLHSDVSNQSDPGANNTFLNTGQLNISDGTQYAVFVNGKNSRPSHFTNEGTFVVEDMDYIVWVNSNGTFTQTATGILKGNGIIRQVGSVSLAGTIQTNDGALGQISMEASTGSATFDLSNVSIFVSAEGTSGVAVPGGHDHINITTNAILTGLQVHVSFDNGFSPSTGDSFDFITVGGTITGAPTFYLPTPPPGTSYNMVNAGGVYTLDVANAPFPVEWLSFDAEQVNNHTRLVWETASERNNEGFSIQRSQDGIAWELIGFVPGQGNAQEAHSYQYFDLEPASGKNLYRLQQWDLDGSSSFSDVVEVTISLQLTDALHVYPIPASESLTVEGVKGMLSIFDHAGKLISRRPTDGLPTVLDITDLPPGMYYVQIQTAEQQMVARRWLKQ